MKSALLKLYTLPFVENKKKELNIDFDESESLRSFIEQKLFSLSKLTTLSFVNQVEMAINDLLVEVSSMFITEEKMTAGKEDILEFCDSIQSLIKHVFKPSESRANHCDPEPNQQSQMKMEIFNFVHDKDTSAVELELLPVEK